MLVEGRREVWYVTESTTLKNRLSPSFEITNARVGNACGLLRTVPTITPAAADPQQAHHSAVTRPFTQVERVLWICMLPQY
jgi:hypothetical protein